MGRIAILVSAKIDRQGRERGARHEAPQRDYFALAEALDAAIINHERVVAKLWQSGKSKTALGPATAMAWEAFRRRDEYDCILSDSEHVGIPLALLFKMSRARKGHVMIGHRLSPRKKAVFFRRLGVQSHIDKVVCYGSTQRDHAISRLRVPAAKVELILHPADHHFWRPWPVRQENLICSAGLEFRDYPTLLEAVKGVDVQLTIAAASPWSRRPNETQGRELPANVALASHTCGELRDLYNRSLFAVVPLYDTEFQAGSLVMYEALAMGKAVVASRTRGQGDILEEGITGTYVPPGDIPALRQAIESLLAHPEKAEEMGRLARQRVQEGLNLDAYVANVARIVRGVDEKRAVTSPASGGAAERSRAR